MALYRRRLPHDYETDQPVFLAWRLPDSLPCHRAFPAATVNSGQAFGAMDRLLDEARSGPFYLRRPAIAMTGSYFWQEESYDRLVRNELEKIQSYIEENPVRAGLALKANEYRWSSAAWVTRGSPADQGGGPTAARRM